MFTIVCCSYFNQAGLRPAPFYKKGMRRKIASYCRQVVKLYVWRAQTTAMQIWALQQYLYVRLGGRDALGAFIGDIKVSC